MMKSEQVKFWHEDDLRSHRPTHSIGEVGKRLPLATIRTYGVGLATLVDLKKGKHFSGTQVLQECLKWCRENDVSSLYLHDASHLDFGKGTKIEFKLWRVLTTGRSWYERHGAVPVQSNKLVSDATDYDVAESTYSEDYDVAKKVLHELRVADLQKIADEILAVPQLTEFKTLLDLCHRITADPSERVGVYLERVKEEGLARFIQEFSALVDHSSCLGVMQVAQAVIEKSELALWVGVEKHFQNQWRWLDPDRSDPQICRIGKVMLDRMRSTGQRPQFSEVAERVATGWGEWIREPPDPLPNLCRLIAAVQLVRICHHFKFEIEGAS